MGQLFTLSEMSKLFKQAVQNAIEQITPELNELVATTEGRVGYGICVPNPFEVISSQPYSQEDLENIAFNGSSNFIFHNSNQAEWATPTRYSKIALGKSLLALREKMHTITIATEEWHLFRPGDCRYGGGVFWKGLVAAISGFTQKQDHDFALELVILIHAEYGKLFNAYRTEDAFI